MFNLKLFPILFLSFFLVKSCYPVSHVIIGEKQTPLDFNDVKVYHDYPDNYEKIAIIEASSDIAIKDLSIEFTDQKKTNKALERLKKEAASLGANGIVIENIYTNTKQHLSFVESTKGEINASSRHEKQKELKAIAIFVK
tara:strand:+ start:316 stop:735 length:420 start_codon:yes stop_codon:yes gene_type:complete